MPHQNDFSVTLVHAGDDLLETLLEFPSKGGRGRGQLAIDQLGSQLQRGLVGQRGVHGALAIHRPATGHMRIAWLTGAFEARRDGRAETHGHHRPPAPLGKWWSWVSAEALTPHTSGSLASARRDPSRRLATAR